MKINKSELTDAELVQRCKNGEKIALSILYERYSKKIICYAHTMIKDSMVAEDIAHDVFLKIINKVKDGNYEERGTFGPWVFSLARNLCIDYLRWKKRTFAVSLSQIKRLEKDNDVFFLDFPDEEKNIEDNIIFGENLQHAYVIMNNLPEEQKEVFVSRIFDNVRFKDIAIRTGVSINTALARMRYANLNIQKMYLEQEYAHKKGKINIVSSPQLL